MNKTIRKAGVFLLGGVIAFLLLEGGLRILQVSQQNRIGLRSPGAARTVLCVGDSFVYGVGAERDKSYPKQLQQLLGPDYSVVNLGRGGQNTADVLQNLRSRIQTVNPDVVVILCGGNNLWSLRGSDNYLNTKSPRARVCDWLSGTRTFRLVKLLRIALRGRTGRALPSQPVSESTMGGPSGKEVKPARGSVVNRKRRWRMFPEFRDCTDAEIAELRETYEKGMRSAPADTGNYQGLGLICLAQRDYKAAIGYFRTAIGKDPGDPRSYIELARVYDEMGKPEEAVVQLHAAIKAEPCEAAAYECLGHAYYHLSRYPDSLRAFRKSLELRPAGGDSNHYKGLMLVAEPPADEETRREAQRLLRDYVQKAETSSPTLMSLISEGKNMSDGTLREWIQGDIEEMIALCRERRAGVILMGYPADLFGNINGILQDIAGKNALPFVNNSALFERMLAGREHDRNGYFAPDGHCNGKGYGVMAMNLYNVMAQNGYAAKHE